jgi:hypothetical protein
MLGCKTYDEAAVRIIVAIETLLERLPHERRGRAVAITNAIENEIEDGRSDPAIVRLLGDAFLVSISHATLDSRTVKRFTQLSDRFTLTW